MIYYSWWVIPFFNKKYKGAHLDVVGKFTFVLPDLYAFCEWLFMGIKVPKGLLENKILVIKLDSENATDKNLTGLIAN